MTVVDGNAVRHGTQRVAEEYLKYLYTPVGQQLAAKHYYRPVSPEHVDAEQLSRFPQLKLFTIDELFGSWASAQAKHFDDGGVFDQIYGAGS